MKYKVVFNDYAYVEGGASNVAISQAVDFAKQGHRVLFVAYRATKIDPRLIENGIEVFYFRESHSQSLLKLFKPFSYVLNPYTLMKKLVVDDEFYAGEVYIHTWTKEFSSSVFIVLKKFKTIYIYSHDYFLECPNGGYFNYGKKEICSLQPLSKSCLLAKCDKRNAVEKYLRFFRTVIQKRLLKNLEYKIIFVSEHQKKVHRTDSILNKESFVIPNLIKRSYPARVKCELNHDVVFVGRFDQEKGVVQLADALSFAGVKAVFVGEGSMKAYIESSGAYKNLLGWQSKDVINEILGSARFVVIPSIWHEADPLVSLEVSEFGIPRIISHVCAAADGVTDGVDGFLVDVKDTESFSALIKRLCEDDDLIRRISVNTYDNFKSSFNDRLSARVIE